MYQSVKGIFSVERRQPQEVWAVTLIIWILDVSDADSFFRCALFVKLLSRITQSRQGVLLTWTLCMLIKIVGFQELSFDQVEKGNTSLLSAFKFNFQNLLQITTELTTDWAPASASSFLRTVVRIETSSAKRAITASSLSKEAKSLM